MTVTTAAPSLRTALRAHQAGQLETAEPMYRTILEAQPENLEAQHLLGVVLLQKGAAEDALPWLERASARDPANADYHNRYGVALAALDRIDDAVTAYRKAIASRPEFPEAHNNLAIALAASGDQFGAIIAYRRALTANPGLAEAHNGLAVALAATGEHDDAEHHYRRALDIQPSYCDARANFGDLLLRTGRIDDAIAELTTVLEQNPGHFDAHLCLAEAYGKHGDIDRAVGTAKSILADNPSSARAHNCYGMVCRQAGDTVSAMTHLDRAVALDPDLADAHANRAITLLDLGQVDAAEKAARRAAALSGSGVHRMNLGMIRLLRGEFRQGFEDYRARFATAAPWHGPRVFGFTPWDGQPIDGQRVLAWGEQGVGEEIMFSSLLERLRSRTDECVIECDSRLVPLFARSFPGLEVVGRSAPTDPVLLRRDFDMTLAFGDIPSALRLDTPDFAHPTAYLVSDAEKTRALHERLDRMSPHPKIGIAWRSRGANTLFSQQKSSELSDWAEILRVPSLQFVSLQYGDIATEIAQAEANFELNINTDTGIDQTADLDGFAALIAALELVITTSNTTAHLAGALGKDVWVILPHVPDWRWQLGRTDTLWYPNARLFCQPHAGDWAGAVAEVAAALSARRAAWKG